MNCANNHIVLDKSFRVPYAVYQTAKSIIEKVHTRKLKKYKPKEEEGLVSYYYDVMDVNFNEGEWYILARTNRILFDVSERLKKEGYVFWKEGAGWSISEEVVSSIEGWLKICNDRTWWKKKDRTTRSRQYIYVRRFIEQRFGFLSKFRQKNDVVRCFKYNGGSKNIYHCGTKEGRVYSNKKT